MRLLEQCGLKLVGVKRDGGLEVVEYVLDQESFRPNDSLFEIRRF